MNFLWKLGCSALVLAVFGVGAVEASDGEPIKPALSLAEELRERVGDALNHPHDESGYLVSQGLVDATGKILDLMVDRLSTFADNYDVCLPTLKMLLRDLVFAYTKPYTTTDYTRCYQDPWFLWNLGSSYRGVFYNLRDIVKLWRKANLKSFDALTRFLKHSIKALRMSHEIYMHNHHILHSDPLMFLDSQGDCSVPIEETASQAVEKEAGITEEQVGNFKRTVCATYKALANEMVDLFDQMISELRDILGGLEGADRDSAYSLFKVQLDTSFWRLLSTPPGGLERQSVGFKTSLCEEPSEVLASAQIRVFERVLKLELELPNMDHSGSNCFGLFSRGYEFCGTSNKGFRSTRDDAHHALFSSAFPAHDYWVPNGRRDYPVFQGNFYRPYLEAEDDQPYFEAEDDQPYFEEAEDDQPYLEEDLPRVEPEGLEGPRGILRELEDLGKDLELAPLRFGAVIKSLRGWVYSLHRGLQPDDCGDQLVTHEQAKEWLNEVEGSLGLALDNAGKRSGRQELYALASSFRDLVSIVLNIERIWGILCRKDDLKWGEDEAGYLLVKLRQVVGKVSLRDEICGVDDSHSKGRPGDDGTRVTEACSRVDEDDGEEGWGGECPFGWRKDRMKVGLGEIKGDPSGMDCGDSTDFMETLSTVVKCFGYLTCC